jgi:hypothetical protein
MQNLRSSKVLFFSQAPQQGTWNKMGCAYKSHFLTSHENTTAQYGDSDIMASQSIERDRLTTLNSYKSIFSFGKWPAYNFRLPVSKSLWPIRIYFSPLTWFLLSFFLVFKGNGRAVRTTVGQLVSRFSPFKGNRRNPPDLVRCNTCTSRFPISSRATHPAIGKCQWEIISRLVPTLCSHIPRK